MELLAEIVASVFQLLVELALQLAGEILGETGIDALGEMWRPSRPPRPALAGLGYFLVGAFLGWVSLWPFPHHLAGSVGLRLLSLGVLPPASAFILWVLLTVIRHPADPAGRRRRFWYAYAFGVAVALMRFGVGHG